MANSIRYFLSGSHACRRAHSVKTKPISLQSHKVHSSRSNQLLVVHQSLNQPQTPNSQLPGQPDTESSNGSHTQSPEPLSSYTKQPDIETHHSSELLQGFEAHRDSQSESEPCHSLGTSSYSEPYHYSSPDPEPCTEPSFFSDTKSSSKPYQSSATKFGSEPHNSVGTKPGSEPSPDQLQAPISQLPGHCSQIQSPEVHDYYTTQPGTEPHYSSYVASGGESNHCSGARSSEPHFLATQPGTEPPHSDYTKPGTEPHHSHHSHSEPPSHHSSGTKPLTEPYQSSASDPSSPTHNPSDTRPPQTGKISDSLKNTLTIMEAIMSVSIDTGFTNPSHDDYHKSTDGQLSEPRGEMDQSVTIQSWDVTNPVARTEKTFQLREDQTPHFPLSQQRGDDTMEFISEWPEDMSVIAPLSSSSYDGVFCSVLSSFSSNRTYFETRHLTSQESPPSQSTQFTDAYQGNLLDSVDSTPPRNANELALQLLEEDVHVSEIDRSDCSEKIQSSALKKEENSVRNHKTIPNNEPVNVPSCSDAFPWILLDLVVLHLSTSVAGPAVASSAVVSLHFQDVCVTETATHFGQGKKTSENPAIQLKHRPASKSSVRTLVDIHERITPSSVTLTPNSLPEGFYTLPSSSDLNPSQIIMRAGLSSTSHKIPVDKSFSILERPATCDPAAMPGGMWRPTPPNRWLETSQVILPSQKSTKRKELFSPGRVLRHLFSKKAKPHTASTQTTLSPLLRCRGKRFLCSCILISFFHHVSTSQPAISISKLTCILPFL